MIILVRFTLVLAVILGPAWASSTSSAQDRAATEITAASAVDKALHALVAFSSIEYEFRAEHIGPGKQSNQSKRTESGRLEYADGKSRSEYTIDSDDYKTSRIIAFDGKEYQLVTENRFPPFIKADHEFPYGTVQPIMYPFLIYRIAGASTKQPRLDLETYRRADLWVATKNAAVLNGNREVDGHPCIVVRLEQKPPSRLANREVCLALDLDFYPILVTFDGGSDGWSGAMRIVEFADLKTSTGRVIVPLRIETKSQDGKSGNQSALTMTIDKEALKVNEAIDSTRFNLRP